MDLAREPSSPTRPPFLRSQSDNSSSRTTLTPSYSLLAVDDLGHDQGKNNKANTVVIPRRPPRNPARSGPNINAGIEAGATTKRVKTVTGTQEEVTPWELHPPPVDSPIPIPSSSKRISIRPSSSGGHSHGPGISFSDLSLLRRRKSTGASKTKAPVTSSADNGPNVLHKQRVTSGSGLPSQSSHNLTTNGNGSPRLSQKIATVISPHPHPRLVQQQQQTSSHTTAPPSLPSRTSRNSTSAHNTPSKHVPGQTSTVSPANSKSSSKSSFEKLPDLHPVPNNNLKFSTADRTILEELKRNISARASQFVIKGPDISSKYKLNQESFPGGSGEGYGGGLGLGVEMNVGGLGVVGGGRKHHPYEKEEVPYPRSYDRDVLDLDVWETLFYQQICESLTWHVFVEPPTKVLDIGCGTGSWILDCARAWRKCHFVGLDVVPVQPDLQQVGSADLAHRVTWVQGNFLEGLPFPNEEFDFVHIKRISLGVPEDKWDALFDEITRVMKPGAAFEMIEEDLLFPGSVVQNEDENESVAEQFNSPSRFHSRHHDTDSAYFSDSDARHYTSSSTSSYFTWGSDDRNKRRNSKRPRSATSAGSTSTTTSMTSTAKSARRQSVPARGANDSSRRRSGTNFEYATLTALMGLGDADNDIAESEREDEICGDLEASPSGSRRSSFLGERERERISDEVPFPLSSSGSQKSPSPISTSLPTPSLPVPSFLASPVSASIPSAIAKLPVITTTTGRGIEVDAIVEDEEGEKSATLDWPSADKPPELNGAINGDTNDDLFSHSQHSTDSTITPASANTVLSMSQPTKLVSVSPSSPPRSTLPRHPLSASTGSLTNLPLSNPYSSNSHSMTLPPKRPLSATSFRVATQSPITPSLSFSQSMLSLSSNSPQPGVDEFGFSRSPGAKPAAPFLLRPLPKPPINPRDHSMLEMIYNEMNAARFVNLSPLSLLPNVLGLHFKDVRTHPPVSFTFPPHPVVEQPPPPIPDDSDPDEDAQEAIRPTPEPMGINPSRGRRMSKTDSVGSSRFTGSPPGSATRPSYLEGGSDNDRWVSVQQIIKRESPYIIYDGSRTTAFSPSTPSNRTSFRSPSANGTRMAASIAKEQAEAEANGDMLSDSGMSTPRGTDDTFNTKSLKPALTRDVKFRLPNTTLNIDIRSLNLHLALRLTEILACSETMWEWVVNFQEETRKKKRLQESRTMRMRSRSIESARPPSRSKQPTPESSDDRLKAAIAELTREDFNSMLRRFCLDMQEQMSLKSALSERFGWCSFPSPPSAERKAFDTEEEAYLQWEAEQHQRISSSPHSPRQRPLSRSSINSIDGLPGSETPNGNSHRNSTSSDSTQGPPSAVPNIPPSRRLSRSLRIFVAWKGPEAS